VPDLDVEENEQKVWELATIAERFEPGGNLKTAYRGNDTDFLKVCME